MLIYFILKVIYEKIYIYIYIYYYIYYIYSHVYLYQNFLKLNLNYLINKYIINE